MSRTLTTHLRSTLIERPIRNSNRSKYKCPSGGLRSILFIILILLTSSFFFDIEFIKLYWLPQQPISSQAIYHKLELQSFSNPSNPSNNTQLNNLLTNQTQFDELLSYYTKVSNNTHPISWIHLNEQLFCPIRYSQSLHIDNSGISNAGERLLKFIYNTQFVSDCDDPKHKFVIFDISQMSGTGIGAQFNGGILKYFFRAMVSNRIFLINGVFGWSKHAQYCSTYIGMECYFLPPSNCDPDNLLEKATKADIWTGSVPTHCTLGDADNECTERIIYSVSRSSGWMPTNKIINEWMHSQGNIFSNFVEFKAVLQAFVFRLKPNVRTIIMEKVRNAFIKSLSDYHFDPYKSISFPIRASDKCHKNKLGLNGEMQCWSKEEIFLVIQAIHVLNQHIDTIIFTSEDFDFVEKLIQCLRYQKHCENTTKMHVLGNYLDFKWNFIVNDEDTKPSIGNANFRVFQENNDDKFEFDDDIGIDLEHDVVVGAFSSMMLQMNSKYVVHTKSSSWLDNIWTMASSLFCESILWSKQLEVNGFNHLNENDMNTNDRKIKKEFDRLRIEYGRPSFLPQYHKKYQFLNRYCFEMKQYGTLNKKTKFKHVLFPPDLWDKIHSLDLHPEMFYSLFGIQIYQNGWDNYCKRYTKLPFDIVVDVGV